MTKILFVVNVDWFFISHRLPLALSALDEGYEVHIACKLTDKSKLLEGFGFRLHSLEFRRESINLISLFVLLINLYFLYKRIKPDIVYLITIKPVLIGGIAARLAKVKSIISAVPGLGFVFLNDQHLKQKIIRFLVKILYKFAFKHPNQRVIFQNSSDQKLLLQATGISKAKSILIRGAGISLDEYSYKCETDNGNLTVVMASRLLKDKGVYEFIDAAKLLKNRKIPANFWLVGDVDPFNPASISKSQVEVWRREGVVSLMGKRTDIAELYSKASIVTLPSYGEGLPKSLMEAAACGRPVVTTDVPGCRDAIINNVTGILVPPADAVALADAIQKLLIDEKIRKEMGAAGRNFAEKEFDIKAVITIHKKIYSDLLQNRLI